MLLVALLLATAVRSEQVQESCVIGKSVSLKLSHQTNSTGHSILQGWLEQPSEAAWDIHVHQRTISCGASSHTQVLSFNLTGASGQAPVRVPPGYVLRDGFGYFRAGTHALEWMAARDACARDGATLAFATSQEEALMLATQFNFDVPGAGVNNRIAWYGASDLAEEGKFVTVRGVNLSETGYATYYPGEPAGKTVENCIFINQKFGLLHDGDCFAPLAYICKFPL